MCIIILCVIILGIAILGVIALIMLGVAKLIMWMLVLWIGSWNWGHTYTQQDFADSRWEDSAGTVIELYSDGTCKVQDLKLNLIYPTTWLEDSAFMKRHPGSFVGRWTISSNQYEGQDIIIEMEKDGRWLNETNFEIEDINVIRRFIGDPDNWEFYTLTRTE